MLNLRISKENRNEELFEKLYSPLDRELTAEEKRSQKISWLLSIAEDRDDQTIRQIERIVDEESV